MAANQFNNWGVLGIKVFYSDSTVLSTKDTPLANFSLNDTQCVNVYYATTYRDGGQDVNYCDTLAQAEFYWVDPTNPRNYGTAVLLRDVPNGMLAFRGKFIEKQAFLDIYNRAYNDRVW